MEVLLKSLHACSQLHPCCRAPGIMGWKHTKETQNKKGSCQVNKSSADFSMQVGQTLTGLSQTTKYPNVLLIKPSIAAKRERERRHGKRFVMDWSRMTMADKSFPNMGTCDDV